MLINELAASKALHVLDRQDLYSLLEQKFTEALLMDARTAKQPDTWSAPWLKKISNV